jgi:FG-GAP repeat.
MKTELIVASFAIVCCATAFAETFPIVDVQYGYLIGAAENGKWIESDPAKKSVKAGAKLQVYGAAGAVGAASVVKLDTQNEPCEDRPTVKLNPKKPKGAIAFAPKWNPLPRKPQTVDVKDKKYVDAVREFLSERGLKDPVVQITQAVKIDIDGDGGDAVVVSATHYKSGDEIPDESAPNTYSFVMLVRFSQGKAEKQLVDGEFYPEPKPEAAPPNKFEIAAIADLNGDGKIDIVVRSRYYEGDEVSVYERTASGFNKALSVGCGL